MEQVKIQSEVILGVDTQLDVHVGVVIDAIGRVQGTLAIATNRSGYEQLVDWAQGFGALRRAGVEGTGSYGSGLTRSPAQAAQTRPGRGCGLPGWILRVRGAALPRRGPFLPIS
jgi:hypothetical protein